MRSPAAVQRVVAATLMAGVLTTLMVGGPASAQAMREVRELPADCRTQLPGAGGGALRPWQAFIWVEHCDRIKRLQRLSAMLPPDQQPQFFEGVIPASRLPTEFNTAMPVLRVVFPERTFFDTATATLRPEAEQITEIVAESLRREPPDVSMFVAGHADARGERGFNERLSIDRANAIAVQILGAGVNLSSIWRVGFGKDMPLVYGMNAYAWDRNRRVEFLFASRPEAVATWLADQQVDNLCQARTSAEVQRCKQQLDFRTGYDAIQVTQAPRREIRPTVTPRPSVTPRGRRPSVAVAPQTPRRVDVAPGTSMVSVDPIGTGRFRIDPVNKRAPRVRIDPKA